MSISRNILNNQNCRFTAHVSKHRHKRSIGTFESFSLKLPDFDCALFAFVAAFDSRNLIKIFGTLCGSVNLFKTSWRIINFSRENRCQKLFDSCRKWEEARVPTFNDRKDLEDWTFLDSRFLLLILKKDLLGEKFLKELFNVKKDVLYIWKFKENVLERRHKKFSWNILSRILKNFKEFNNYNFS